MKSTKEWKKMDIIELEDHLKELRKDLMKLNVEVATGANPKSPGKIKQIKKNIARILTIIKEKKEVLH